MNAAKSSALLAAAIAAVLSTAALADAEPRRYCSDSLVRGTYGVQMQGTRPVPGDPDGKTESVIGVIVLHYDGQGNVTQIANIKGSVSGIVPNRLGTGTYKVTDDCSVVIEFRPGPNLLLREQAVIVEEGKELHSITVFPPGVMVTATHRRI